MKKNINTALQNTWLSIAYIIILSFLLLISQLGFAKDRIQYHVQNFDGSTLKVINEQGVVSQSYQYAPFGQQLQLKKPTNLKNPRAFVGGVQDANDLVYLKQRHYNPVLGRFYQPDPIGFITKGDTQINRYHYGGNDSYTFSDPSGLCYMDLNCNGMWGPSFLTFSPNQTGLGVQNQFNFGSGPYFADPEAFNIEKTLFISQRIQTSALNPQGYIGGILSNLTSGSGASFSWKQSFGENYPYLMLTGSWPFGRISTVTEGKIFKDSNGTYEVYGHLRIINDSYSWKQDGNSAIQRMLIGLGGGLLKQNEGSFLYPSGIVRPWSQPSSAYNNSNFNGEMPVIYGRVYDFRTVGRWK